MCKLKYGASSVPAVAETRKLLEQATRKTVEEKELMLCRQQPENWTFIYDRSLKKS